MSCLVAAAFLTSSAWGNEEPKEIALKDKRWKQSSNLTVKTLNKTKRTVDLKPANSKEQFAYIRAESNNKESFRITCKFIPKVHEETDIVMTVKVKWKLSDQKKTLPEKETEQDWALPYETDLADIQPDNPYAVTSTMFVEKKSTESESEVKKIMGQPHYVLIYDANLTLGVKTMAFNTHPGKIENDAFDVVDQVKGKVMNNTPEFKDGKQVTSNTIVVYPVNTKPTVKVKLQMISERLTPDQLQKLDWKAEATSHQQGEEEESIPRENVLPELKLGDSGTLNKETQGKILFMEGDFSPEDNLGETLVRGKIDLDWKLKIGEDEIKMEKQARSKIDNAFRILRTQEIDQTNPGDTKIWGRGIVVAVDTFMESYWKPRSSKEYAEHLTDGIYNNSVYPKDIVRKYSSNELIDSSVHYNIYLGKMINMYLNDSILDKEIICVEAAALFRSLCNLVTDGGASASSITRQEIAHQVGIREGLVHDPTPKRKNGDIFPELINDNRNGILNLTEYIDFLNTKTPINDQWRVKRIETKHRVSN